MRGGYLTLDLRELKDTSGESRIIKKGIYKYIHNTSKPIEIILSQELVNKINSLTTAVEEMRGEPDKRTMSGIVRDPYGRI